MCHLFNIHLPAWDTELPCRAAPLPLPSPRPEKREYLAKAEAAFEGMAVFVERMRLSDDPVAQQLVQQLRSQMTDGSVPIAEAVRFAALGGEDPSCRGAARFLGREHCFVGRPSVLPHGPA